MMKTKHKLASSVAVVVAAAAMVVGFSASANAATQTPLPDKPQTIAPGGYGDVGARVFNQFGTPQSGWVELFLSAPPHSKFVEPKVWGTKIISGVRENTASPVFTDCTLTRDDTAMQCSGTLTIPAAANSVGSGVDLTMLIKADSDAAPSTTYTTQFSGFRLTNSTNVEISGGNTELSFQTPAVADTPVIAPAVGGGVALIALLTVGGVLLRRRQRTS